jgi:ATP-binding protein involved in chromosome partitioning
MALAAADGGNGVGLFDLDFTSPTDHVILGAESQFPDEEFGIDPLPVQGVKLMSVALFSGPAPVPLRGAESTNALLELLAVTRWGELDLLVLDLPPGLGDVTLDVFHLLPRTELLLLGTASKIVTGSVRRALALATELRVPVLGLIENLRRTPDGAVARMAAEFSIPFLGAIDFDPTLEAAIGDVERLRRTHVYEAVREISQKAL